MLEDRLSKLNILLHGCDYNPEQWLDYPEVLRQDIEYMKKAHCNVMSVGIFSWAFLEPEEGVYSFEYFDEIIKNLTENGIKIILATPSGAKPRWLAQKYPETLRVGKNNVRDIYGFRHNHCYTSLIYRQKITKLDSLLARRYASNENVILWHISNELGGECHCELCQEAFRAWLRKKYNNSLDELNHTWWTGFWSHRVTEWQQIHSPTENGEPDVVLSGLYLDWKEFVTYQTTDFMNEEIKAVKAVNKNIPVTTNFMGPYQQLDYHYMKDFVDVISWDSYPEWHSERGNVLEAYSIAFAHDLHRSLKHKPFLLMESTPSITNWLSFNKLKRPMMHKLSSVQAIAHGSDSVQYFQWRKGRGGSEKFHGAVIDHNGKAEGRVFNDVREVGILLERLGGIAGSETKSDVAVVYEFKNRWAIENAQGFCNIDKKYKRTCINHYREFWKRGINVDVIGIDNDLSRYKILVLPMLYSISEKMINKIEEFVASGGTAVATYMTGYVDESDLCCMGGFPNGRLKEVFGITADEIDTLYENEVNFVVMDGKRYKAVDYCEIVTPTTAEALGSYATDFYAGGAAVTENRYKKGKAYYIAFRDTGEFLNDLYERIIDEKRIEYFDLPEGVTIHTRQNKKEEYVFVENYAEEAKVIKLCGVYTEVDTGRTYSDPEVALGKYDVKIYKKDRNVTVQV